MLKRITVSFLGLLVVTAGCAANRPATQHAELQVKESPRHDFPFTIAFEQGLTQFQPGDQITITDVHGTNSEMQGGIYRISGTYTLASQDEATLAASVTARDSANGRGFWNKAQTTTITKGHGSFTLLLPVSVPGWPHVSFYGKADAFGGIYVGTGDSVLRHW
jgi:hypothetical protein